jgi:hypothetical protein
MWRDAPLSKYHALLGVVLVERQDTNEKSLLNFDASSFNCVFVVAATCLSSYVDIERKNGHSYGKCNI